MPKHPTPKLSGQDQLKVAELIARSEKERRAGQLMKRLKTLREIDAIYAQNSKP
jgi:hypothetical protein